MKKRIEPIRVIINSESLLKPKTGIGYYIINLYEELKEKTDIDITLSHLPSSHKQPIKTIENLSLLLKKLLKDKYPKGIASQLCNCKYSISSSLRKKKHTLNHKDFDLYHEPGHSILQDLISIKKIAEIHDLAGVKYPNWTDPHYQKMIKNNLNKLLEFDRIIVKSTYIKNELISEYKVDPARIDVIPNAIGVKNYKIGNKLQHERTFRKIIQKPFLLFVGTVEPRKNLDCLLRALSIIQRKYDVALVIVGKAGWNFEKSMKLIKTLNLKKCVKLLGYTDEVKLLYLYHLAEVFVFPSFYEGFGIPPLEAMACGTPVIASNASAIPEVVGDAALLFNPHDHEELAHLIDKVLSSEELAANLREKGLERVKLFSWSKTAEITVQTYKKTLEN